MLPAEDIAYLKAKELSYEVVAEGGHLCLVISGYRLPTGYSATETDLLVRLPPGWPDSKPDMFWVNPPIAYANGTSPATAASNGTYVGRTWQRFSRHLANGQWRPGDNLETWLTVIRKLLTEEVPA